MLDHLALPEILVVLEGLENSLFQTRGVMSVSICITHLPIQLLQLEDLPTHHRFSQESTIDLGLHFVYDDIMTLRSNTMQVYCSHDLPHESFGSESLDSGDLLPLFSTFFFAPICHIP